MTKKELRKLFLEKRKALSEAEFSRLNFSLFSKFFAAVDLSSIHVLHCYLPMTAHKEPNTWLILDQIQSEFPNVRICIPRVSGDMLENIAYEGREQLQLSSWGIPEPSWGDLVPAGTIDLVLVPLLAVDKYGHRVGYGKGFYDRLLRLVKPDCRKVGLSFFEPVEAVDDAEIHDIPLDECITPLGSVMFRRHDG